MIGLFKWVAALVAFVYALPKLGKALVHASQFVVNFNRLVPTLETLPESLKEIKEKANEIKAWTAGHEAEDRKTFKELRQSQEEMKGTLSGQNQVLAKIDDKVSA